MSESKQQAAAGVKAAAPKKKNRVVLIENIKTEGGSPSDVEGETKSKHVACEAAVKTEDEALEIKLKADPALIKWVTDNCSINDEFKETHKGLISRFLVNPASRKLILCKDDEGHLQAHLDAVPPLEKSRRIHYFLKISPKVELTPKNISSNMLHGTISGEETMDSLVRLMHGLYVPTFLGNKSWPESVRKEFAGQVHRFMARLVDATNQKKGKTMLYLPEEDLFNPEEAAKDKVVASSCSQA